MWRPLTRKDWLEHRELFKGAPDLLAKMTVEEDRAIENNADWLLGHLYEPDAETGHCFRGRYLVKAGVPQIQDIAQEPINWGDLKAYVEQDGDVWVVTLEEASPGGCPALCAYVKDWLVKWGWPNVVVETTW